MYLGNLGNNLRRAMTLNFAKIKMRPKQESEFQVQKIVKTFIKVPDNIDGKKMKDLYFKHWQNLYPHPFILQFQKFLQADHDLKVVEFTCAEIAKRYTEYTLQAQNVITNFLHFWLASMNSAFKSDKAKANLQYITMQKMFFLINAFIPLVRIDRKLLMAYFQVFAKLSYHKSFNSTDYVYMFRILIDQAIKIPKEQIDNNFIYFMLYICSRFSIHVWHHEESTNIIFFFLKNVNEGVLKNQNHLTSIITSITKLGIKSKLYEKILTKTIKENFNFISKNYALRSAIDLLIITKDNYLEFQKQIRELQKHKMPFFLRSFEGFYRAAIWDKQYWKAFFQTLCEQSNYKQFKPYSLFVVYKLLEIEKDLIDDQIIKAGKEAFNHLQKKKNFSVANLDLHKEYLKISNPNNQRVNCQKQLTNSLRLISRNQVHSEILVQFFYVDIMINGKLVVQVNSGLHYIHNCDDTEKKQKNLKTQFRDRIIKKKGFSIIHIDVYEFNEGSFQLIRQISESADQLSNEALQQ